MCVNRGFGVACDAVCPQRHRSSSTFVSLAFRVLRQRRHSEAAELVIDVASLADCMDEDGVNAKRLGERMQSALNNVVAEELVELERSAMPGYIRPRRGSGAKSAWTRTGCDARGSRSTPFLENGRAVDDAERIGAAIAQHRAAILAEKDVEESDAEFFLAHIPEGGDKGLGVGLKGGSASWRWLPRQAPQDPMGFLTASGAPPHRRALSGERGGGACEGQPASG